MKYYMAPLEGVTSYTVRNGLDRFFPGADKYFTPFIPAGKNFSQSIKRDLNPSNNKGIVLVPQVISNNAEEMPGFEKKLMDLGYEEYNLNLGCPSGTVTAKGRGSGFLKDPETLDNFLYEVYSNTKMRLSIKTRIGYEEEEEWEDLLAIYLKYPMSELIIHPRLRMDFYRGEVRFNSYKRAEEEFSKDSRIPLCYNGDINEPEDMERLKELKYTDSVMIGRGMLRRPWLIGWIKTGEIPGDLDKRILGFMEYLYGEFSQRGFGERDVIMHLKEIWGYLGDSFLGGERIKKKILKSRTREEFFGWVREIVSLKLL